MIQYSKALQGLQEILSGDSVSLDMVLVCVLLMTHFEALRENFIPALMHVEHAIRLLYSRGKFDARRVEPGLIRSLMRLDIQGAMYLGLCIPGLPFYIAVTDTSLPSSMHDLTQARDLVNTWTCRLLHWVRTEADEYKFRETGNIPLEMIAKAHDFTQTFMDLDQLLWDYMHKPTVRMTIREQHGLGMLRSRVKINRIISATCLYCEASMYDVFMQEFEEILTICMFITNSDNADRRLFSVSLDEGLLHPLSFVATLCRDSTIRHQALTQLKRLPAGKGIWHVEAMTRTAEMCVKFEERWCETDAPTCHDIPEWRRVYSAGFKGWETGNITFDSPCATVVMRLRPNGMDGEWMDYTEDLSWQNHVPESMDKVYHVVIERGLKSNMITWP